MKQLIYIDNDRLERAEKDWKDYAKIQLKVFGNVPMDILDSCKIIADFTEQDKDVMYKTLFDPNNVTITWSVYTPSPYSNSKAQLLNFLATAGSHHIKKVVYIDCTGLIEKALTSALEDDYQKRVTDIYKGIQNNYIITREENSSDFIRLNVHFEGDKIFKHEKIELITLLQ